MTKRVKKWLSLSRDEKYWYWRCWWQFAKWHLIIQYLPYTRWSKVIKSKTPNKSKQLLTIELKRAIALSEMAGRHHLFPINCLRRCLVQQQLLQPYGFQFTLHFGVAITSGNLKAHCWLTHNGALINDSPAVVAQYSELKMAGDQLQQCVETLT